MDYAANPDCLTPDFRFHCPPGICRNRHCRHWVAKKKDAAEWRAPPVGQAGRRGAKDKAVFDALRATGACCYRCKHFRREDPCPGIKGTWCDLDSDFHGYAMTASDDLCLKFSEVGND